MASTTDEDKAQAISSLKEQFPFELGQLQSFHQTFDVLKGSVEYLARQQQGMAALLVDLAENNPMPMLGLRK